MAVDSLGSKRQPQFLDGGAPDIAVDPSAVADYAAYVGNYIVDTTAARTAAATWAWEGLLWRDTTDGYLYERRAGAWVVIEARASIRAIRAANSPTVSSAALADISANANWSTTAPAGEVKNFAAYNNGFTIPVSGVYLVGHSIVSVANIGLVAGITVNKSTGVDLANLRLVGVCAPTGGLTAAGASGETYLAAGDVVRLYAIAASGTPALSASLGHFFATWQRSA